jgi:hypothetical protein
MDTTSLARTAQAHMEHARTAAHGRTAQPADQRGADAGGRRGRFTSSYDTDDVPYRPLTFIALIADEPPSPRPRGNLTVVPVAACCTVKSPPLRGSAPIRATRPTRKSPRTAARMLSPPVRRHLRCPDCTIMADFTIPDEPKIRPGPLSNDRRMKCRQALDDVDQARSCGSLSAWSCC